MYIGWATNVNKIIEDSTPVTVGSNATVTDSVETGGLKKRRVVNANPADVFNVTMAFDFAEVDENGYTELERFYSWYKYQHCYGTNPFNFPAILINSNRQKGNSQEEIENIIQRMINGDPTAKMPDEEYYVITSALEGNKSGHSLEIKMTWETYATGSFTIPTDVSEVDHITAQNGYVDITLTSEPPYEPTISTYSLKINTVPVTPLASTYNGDLTVRYYFTPITIPGTYIAAIGDKTSTFVVV